MSNIQPRRRSEPVNVGRARPVSRVIEFEEQNTLTRFDARRDRDFESRHVLEMRELRREVDQQVAETAGAAAVAVSAVQARRRYNYEAKQELLRARKESQILAGDDPELSAKFSLMDDDLFKAARLLGLDLD